MAGTYRSDTNRISAKIKNNMGHSQTRPKRTSEDAGAAVPPTELLVAGSERGGQIRPEKRPTAPEPVSGGLGGGVSGGAMVGRRWIRKHAS